MKQVKLLIVLTCLAVISACTKDNNPAPVVSPDGGQDTNLRGEISEDRTLTKDKTWILRGYVYITNGATLTIEPGTRIISNIDSSGVLIITPGAKINAKGTADAPVVFTSGESNAASGDLGGLVLMGKATSNGNHSKAEGGLKTAYTSFGGSNDADNSGILSYVRIEYAGKAVNPDDEVNGLSLYAVGSGTTIDHIEVLRGLDDAHEFFGGAVQCKYLVAYNCADDDFVWMTAFMAAFSSGFQ